MSAGHLPVGGAEGATTSGIPLPVVVEAILHFSVNAPGALAYTHHLADHAAALAADAAEVGMSDVFGYHVVTIGKTVTAKMAHFVPARGRAPSTAASSELGRAHRRLRKAYPAAPLGRGAVGAPRTRAYSDDGRDAAGADRDALSSQHALSASKRSSSMC